MSGIMIGLSSAANGGAAPPAPLTTNLIWNGANPLSITSSNGTTSNKLVATPSGGIAPYSYAFAVTANGGGKLSLSGSGNNRAIVWSGMNVLESETISVTLTVSDSNGDTASASNSVRLNRTS